jgi:hypothetical protein
MKSSGKGRKSEVDKTYLEGLEPELAVLEREEPRVVLLLNVELHGRLVVVDAARGYSARR